jgi:hypothetical protein
MRQTYIFIDSRRWSRCTIKINFQKSQNYSLNKLPLKILARYHSLSSDTLEKMSKKSPLGYLDGVLFAVKLAMFSQRKLMHNYAQNPVALSTSKISKISTTLKKFGEDARLLY